MIFAIICTDFIIEFLTIYIYSAIGCTEPIPPPHGWHTRNGSLVTFVCSHSQVSWYQQCVGSRWIGGSHACPKPGKGATIARCLLLLNMHSLIPYLAQFHLSTQITGLVPQYCYKLTIVLFHRNWTCNYISIFTVVCTKTITFHSLPEKLKPIILYIANDCACKIVTKNVYTKILNDEHKLETNIYCGFIGCKVQSALKT